MLRGGGRGGVMGWTAGISNTSSISRCSGQLAFREWREHNDETLSCAAVFEN